MRCALARRPSARFEFCRQSLTGRQSLPDIRHLCKMLVLFNCVSSDLYGSAEYMLRYEETSIFVEF